jgi:two-component system, chemotaxis family, CheB/CheR fusion protein
MSDPNDRRPDSRRKPARPRPDAPTPVAARTLLMLPRDVARVPFVGIGALAGGLAAFETFFSALPAEPESRLA